MNMNTDDVILRIKSVGIHGLSDNELVFLASRDTTNTNMGRITTELIKAARFEVSRRHDAATLRSAEALIRVANAQNKNASRLICATWALVIATIGLVVATIWPKT